VITLHVWHKASSRTAAFADHRLQPDGMLSAPIVLFGQQGFSIRGLKARALI
jgi:hypothetical protein